MRITIEHRLRAAQQRLHGIVCEMKDRWTFRLAADRAEAEVAIHSLQTELSRRYRNRIAQPCLPGLSFREPDPYAHEITEGDD